MKRLIISLMCMLAVCCGEKIDSKSQHYTEVIAVHLYPRPNEVYLNPGQTFQISWSVSPSDGFVNETWWTTYKEDVITVDDNGLVSAIGIGDDRVFMRAMPSGRGEHFYFHVVSTPVPLQTLKLAPANLEVRVGSSEGLELECYPTTTTQRDFTWKSSKEDVAKVDDSGKITGLKVGTSTITVTESESGLTASATVNVVQAFTSLEVAYPSSKYFTVEKHDNKSCYAMVAGSPYKIVCNTKPSNATDEFVYTVESGKSEYLSINSEGEMLGNKYGGPVAVTVSSRLNENLSSTFYVFIYDEPTGVELVGRNIEGIGTNCSQTWTVKPTPSTAFPYYSYGKPEAEDGLTASQSGTTLTVKAAALQDSQLSTYSTSRYKNVTLHYANYSTTVRFKLCKYDPFQCKIGDGLVIRDNALCCYDGGYRGLGVTEKSAFNSKNEPPFAIIAYIGDEQLTDPFLRYTTKLMTLSSFGVTKMYTGETTKKTLPAKIHGIAVPYNDSYYCRAMSLNGWNGMGTGEKYMTSQRALSTNSMMPNGLPGKIMLEDGGDLEHCAYMNTMAYVVYNSRTTDSNYQICPAIYVDSEIIMKDYNKAAGTSYSNKYSNYYIGTKDNYARLNQVSAGVSNNGAYTTPWLLPTVKDMFVAFGLNPTTWINRHAISDANVQYVRTALENAVLQLSGKSCTYRNNYWTSNEAGEGIAWMVNVGVDDVTAATSSKIEVRKVLPVLYF